MSTEANLKVRELRSRDAKLLAEFFKRNDQPQIIENFHPFPLTTETANCLARNPGLDHFYIAVSGNKCIAFAMLRGWNEGFEIPSFGILVDCDHQGLGIGRQLGAEVLEKANLLAEAIRLSVNKSNQIAIRLYQSLGFTICNHAEVSDKSSIVMVKKFNVEK